MVDIPCAQLTSALNFPESKVQNLQKTLQGALDHREEVRQAKELLQLYVKAVEKQDSQEAQSGLEGTAGANDRRTSQHATVLRVHWRR